MICKAAKERLKGKEEARRQKAEREDCISQNVCPDCGKELIVKADHGGIFRDTQWKQTCPVHGLLYLGPYGPPG